MTEQENNQPRVETKRIYISDLSFESPNAVEGTGEWKPEVSLNITHTAKTLNDDHFEVRLKCTATCRNNKKTAYIVEVEQAGIFYIFGMPQEQAKTLLNTFCPNMLFPYVRETIDSMLLKGSFQPLMLAPINFDALYAQSQQQEAKDKAKAEEKPAAEPGVVH